MAARGRSTDPLRRFISRVSGKRAQVGVIGLGYVGLPLAVEFAKTGFRVTGFEIDGKRVAALNAGRSYIQDVPSRDVRESGSDGPVPRDARLR